MGDELMERRPRGVGAETERPDDVMLVQLADGRLHWFGELSLSLAALELLTLMSSGGSSAVEQYQALIPCVRRSLGRAGYCGAEVSEILAVIEEDQFSVVLGAMFRIFRGSAEDVVAPGGVAGGDVGGSAMGSPAGD